MKKNMTKPELQKRVLILEQENKALQTTVTRLLKELDNSRGTKSSLILPGNLSAEEEIVEIQIGRLRRLSRERLLDPDETKQLDLLVKNKKILEASRKPEEPDFIDVTPEELLQIAEGNNEQEESEPETQREPS